MTEPAQAADEGGVLDLFDAPVADEPDPLPPKPAPSEEAKRKRRKILAIVLAAVLLIVGILIAWYLMNRKPLSELPGVNVVPVPSYKTAIYGVEKPLGVAVSPDGSRVYVSSSTPNSNVVMLDPAGRKLGELKPPEDSGNYHVPVYIALSPDATRVYVGDRAAGQVYIYDINGTYISTFTPADPKLTFSPLGVAVAADGSLYVADVSSDKPKDHRILVFAADGTLKQTLGKGELNYPNEIVVDAAGTVFVTDSNAGRLVQFSPDGTLTMLVSHGVGEGDLGLPRGLAIDDRGRMYVVDTTDHMVRMYTKPDTTNTLPVYTGTFGDQGIGDGQFMYPNGLSVDARSRVYVTDRENNRVQIWGY